MPSDTIDDERHAQLADRAHRFIVIAVAMHLRDDREALAGFAPQALDPPSLTHLILRGLPRLIAEPVPADWPPVPDDDDPGARAAAGMINDQRAGDVTGAVLRTVQLVQDGDEQTVADVLCFLLAGVGEMVRSGLLPWPEITYHLLPAQEVGLS